MRALALNEAVDGQDSSNRYTVYTNETMANLFKLYPVGTSCVFTEFKLYKDETGTPYTHNQIQIIQDSTARTTEMISMKIDTSKVFNEIIYIQAKTRGKILS